MWREGEEERKEEREWGLTVHPRRSSNVQRALREITSQALEDQYYVSLFYGGGYGLRKGKPTSHSRMQSDAFHDNNDTK